MAGLSCKDLILVFVQRTGSVTVKTKVKVDMTTRIVM